MNRLPVVAVVIALAAAAQARAVCLPDAVASGPTCVDRYEASVWSTKNPKLIRKIQAGAVTLTDLMAAGAVQHGVSSDDYGIGCPDDGQGCLSFYAVSIAGVPPSRFLTWFQAAAAARNSGKRLPTNAEWQVAALGTPDSAPCVVSTGGTVPTGTPGCTSDVGAFDMVGNVDEWTADWVPLSTDAPGWSFSFSDDFMGLAGASVTGESVSGTFGPGAIIRGGDFSNGAGAGVFAVLGGNTPLDANDGSGFRCAR